ncbi:hypothetical protein B7R70_07730 [Yersinia pseudotuberculosis]|uniref:hypothetical protein n=1 Tax=Yersinia pseudotuberculosis TaxID=633 RepID=UPI0005DD57F8|nr:hypothetical protein [Yersinia pseudotuberculosis]PSH17671.1 hypothetical protein BLA52_13245 [Yersinia pseudotuberculosis]PSH27848.1 hypothetical protein BLA50_03420 [Yersinia pseudotuberculosis]PSH33469.1 hypothetical protein BA197_15610 [Yersinia pseudotuberculosis]PST80120.1 hypothetical protein B7R70_07730 [Yersinia pseudotuberculosis]CND46341.1 Uncharacterised protein [Yersinia pseudotuberculosis]
MKELNSFTVERLEELSTKENIPEVAALARIALAAKRAEPVAWEVKGILCHSKEEADSYVGEPVPLYEAPQLNSPEIPDGWKLVPIEPTAEMMAAAMECDDVVFDLDDDTIFCVQFDNIYAAMLAAAPEPQNQQQNIPEIIHQGWTSSDPANAALVMLDRIDTMDSADDDRIEDIKLIIRQLAAEPEKGNG